MLSQWFMVVTFWDAGGVQGSVGSSIQGPQHQIYGLSCDSHCSLVILHLGEEGLGVLDMDGAMKAQRGEALHGVPQLAYDIGRQTQVSAPICWYASPSEYG